MTQRSSALAFSIALVVAVCLVYFPGLRNDLVFDDARLTDGTIFGTYGSLFELRRRMFSYGSFVWVQSLLGEGWWKQRLVNVLLHLGVVGSLYLLFRDLLGRLQNTDGDTSPGEFMASRLAALRIGVALFAVNPVAVYGVGYLVQRSTVMATLFVVLACLGFVRGLTTRQPLWFGAALLAYFVAVFSKEQAFAAAALSVPLYIFVARPSWKRVLVVSGVSLLFLVVGVAVLLRIYGSLLGATFDENSRIYTLQLEALRPGIAAQVYPLSILNQAALFFNYGLLWFLPNVLWMSVDLRPGFPLSLWAFPQVLGAVAFVGVLCTSVWLVLRRSDAWGLAGLCVLMPVLLFLPEFATVWLQDPFVLYRSYLWALSVPGLVALVLLQAPSRVIYPVGIVVAGLFAGLALERTLSFQNELSVWADAVDKVDLKASQNAVGRWRPYINRGAYYLDRGTPELAYRDFVQADGLGELQGSARFNMGVSLQLMNKHSDALAAFASAEKLGFTEASLYYQRGESLYALGRFAEAFDSYTTSLGKPQADEAHSYTRMRRAESAIAAQRFDDAIKDLTAALVQKPDDRRLLAGLGMAYVGKRDTAAAIPIFDKLLAAKPTATAYYGRGLAYAIAGNKAAGLKDLDQAIALEPNNQPYAAQRAQLAAQK